MMLEENLGRQIAGISIADAWELGNREILNHGIMLPTGRDEQFGTRALTLNCMQVWVTDPFAEPMVSNYNPNSRKYCEQYALEYLMTDNKKPDEEYTYGHMAHINDQIKKAIEKLKNNPNLRDCIIQIADTKSIDLKSPQCLRALGLRRVKCLSSKNYLFLGWATMRSWDFYGAGNSNMYAFVRTLEWILKEADEKYILNWFMVNGIDAHIYEKQLNYVKEQFKIKSVLNK